MFATLLGPLPRPPLPDDAAPEAVLDAILAVQVEHGLEPVTDGGWPIEGGTRGDPDPVAAWRSTTARAGRLVKAVFPGPFTTGSDGRRERAWLRDLAEAGCRWVEIHEPGAVAIGVDDAARARFATLHGALTADLPGVHLSLAVTGGSAHQAGIETLSAGDYASLAVDLIDGPDAWSLVVAAPATVGIVAGVLSARSGSDDGPEILLWAASYAAAAAGRGMDRVGLATASSYTALPWDVAVTKIQRLGEGTRLATAPREEQLRSIDPRAIDARSAALGRYEPRPQRPKRPTS